MRKLSFIIGSLFSLLIITGIALIVTSRIFDGHSLLPAPPPNNVVLDNVNVVPITQNGVIRHQKVVVESGRIVAIEPAGSPYRQGIEVLDMESRYLVPGLVDMHVHIDDREQLRLSLAHGVTAVRNMDGMPFHLRWRDELAKGEWMGSRLYTASPALHGQQYSSFYNIIVRGAVHATELNERLAAEGWDFIKIYSGLGLNEFHALLDTREDGRLAVAGHVPYEVVKDNYLQAGKMLTIEHVEEIFQGPLEHKFDLGRLSDVIADLASVHAVVCPTLSTFENLTRLSTEKTAYLATLPTEHMTAFGQFFRQKTDIERWLNVSDERGEYNSRELSFLKLIVKGLDDGQVRMVLGTDSGTNFVQAGPSLWQEMELMLESGLKPSSVLRAATLNSAAALGVKDDYGSIEVGKVADFVVTKLNPLESMSTLASIEGVVVDGNYLDKRALAGLSSGQSRVAGWWRSIARYFDAILVRMVAY